MIAYFVMLPLQAGWVDAVENGPRESYVVERLELEGALAEADLDAWYGWEEEPNKAVAESEVAAARVDDAIAAWIAEHGDPGPAPRLREQVVLDNLVEEGTLDAGTLVAWEEDGTFDADEYRRIDALVTGWVREHGEPEEIDVTVQEDAAAFAGSGWITLLGSLSFLDLLWVPLMCAAAYKTGNGD